MISYHPCKFQLSRTSGFNCTEGVENTPPPPSAVPREKSPVLSGLKVFKVESFQAGQLNQSLEKWKSLTSDKKILQVI